MNRTGSIVRSATPDDDRAVAELLDRTFGKRPYEQRLALWKWRYDRNPAPKESIPPFLVIEEKGSIVGVHGLIPLRIKAGSRQLIASCSCDLAADPAARSAGMKLKLAALSREVSPLHISTSANEPANKITLALGGKEVFSGRRTFIKPLKASGLMRRGLTAKGTPGGIATAASLALGTPADWALAIDRMTRPPGNTAGAGIRNVTTFDDRYDEFWKGMAEDHMILAVRDSSYLNWRYSEYPFPGIQSFELSRGKDLLGFSVLHVGVDEDRLRFAALLELACRETDSGVPGHLLREAIRRAARAGSHYLIARAPTPECEALFQRHGCIRREMKYSPITYKNNSDMPNEAFAQDGNWYLSLGDGDGCHYL